MINTVTLIGRLTKDAELKYTPQGTAVANFSVAVSEKIKQDDGSWQEVPHFFDIQYWGKPAEGVCQYLTKGKQIGIQGKLKQHRWTTEAGENRSRVGVTAFVLELLGGPAQQDSSQQGTPPAPRAPQQAEFDEIPRQDNARGFQPPPGPPGPEHFNDDIPF